MKKLIYFMFLTAFIMLVCSGCATYQSEVKPPQGIFFTSIKAPLTVNFDHTPTNAKLLKTSYKKTQYFQDFLLTWMNFAWGDINIPMIANKAGINKVAYADCEFLNILNIYAEFKVNIYGYADEKNDNSPEL